MEEAAAFAVPEVEAHRHASGHRWLDLSLSVAAVFISLTTTVLAFQHGGAMEEMVRQNAAMVQASTWPYVVTDFSNSDDLGAPLYRLEARNSGVGPARIASVTYRFHGRRVSGRSELANLVAASVGRRGEKVLAIANTGGVIPANHAVQLITVRQPASPKWLVDAFVSQSAFIDASVCYCSILKECWTGDTGGDPVPVASCTPPDRPVAAERALGQRRSTD